VLFVGVGGFVDTSVVDSASSGERTVSYNKEKKT
jgi:hypothetical protein